MTPRDYVTGWASVDSKEVCGVCLNTSQSVDLISCLKFCDHCLINSKLRCLTLREIQIFFDIGRFVYEKARRENKKLGNPLKVEFTRLDVMKIIQRYWKRGGGSVCSVDLKSSLYQMHLLHDVAYSYYHTGSFE